MTTSDEMTWVKGQNRWMKSYRGKTYAVSPRQLGLADGTEEETRASANSWWQEKRRQIDGCDAVHPSEIATPVGFFVRGVLSAKIVVKWSQLMRGATHWNFTEEEIREVIRLLGDEAVDLGAYVVYLSPKVFTAQEQVRYVRYILEHLD
jgi:hypothetical protein